MKKIGLGILFAAVAVILTAGIVFALPSNRGIDKAREVSPAIADEGLKAPPEFVAQLPENKLTKIVFIRYAPGFQKGKTCNNDGICDSDEKGWCADCKKEGDISETSCYGFLAGSKPRWNWTEDYIYNDGSLSGPFSDAVAIWENPVSGDIFGAGNSGSGYTWGVYDYVNSISSGDYPEEGVLAVTAIWFRGKNIYEYDIMFDTDYAWGDVTINPNVFDLPTVALHELGHGAGLGDLYDVACKDNVMYGYISLGEEKRILVDGDIIGIQKLYGK